MLRIPADRFRTVLTAVAAAAIAGCGDRGSDIQEPDPVTTVTVTAAERTVTVGQALQLTATARNGGGTPLDGRTFEWTSSDEAIASVSQNGLVTGVAQGQAEIRANTEGVDGTYTVTVIGPSAPPAGGTSVGLQPIATGLTFPVGLASPPGDPRLFVLEKGGAIRVVKDGTLLPTPFLDLAGQVSTAREQGLLGLAFFPDYVSTGRFLVHYTNSSGDTHISIFRVSANPDVADPGSESVLLAVDQPGPSHNGGQIVFGPDGYLYIALGDGGSRNGQDRGRAQSIEDLLGSILRVDVSGGSSYTIPSDNPFVGVSGAKPEVWSYGLRNPWRFSFDRATGDLYIADVGEKRWEEVNRSTAADGAGRGANYGWSVMEGRDCFHDSDCDQTGLSLPVLQYDHSQGCSITGGYVYRGPAIPALQGHYFYADFCQGWVRSFRQDGGGPLEQTDWPGLSPGGPVTSFGEDSTGELYVLTADGGVFRIVPQ